MRKAGTFLLILAAVGLLRADQVEMQNGDHYLGKVLSLGTNSLVLLSDVLGRVELPRSQVASISLGMVNRTNATGSHPILENQTIRFGGTTNPPSLARAADPKTNAQSAALRQLAASTNLVKKVQQQFLAGAGPEANDKFNEMLSGFLSGKLSVDDIRAEAKSAAEQLRSAKHELGDEAGWSLDAYLAILDHFLKETKSPASVSTNVPASKAKAVPVEE